MPAAKWAAGDTLFNSRLNVQGCHELGGNADSPITDTGYVPVPGHRIVEIDGTVTSAGIEMARAEVHLTAKVASGTGYARLWDIDAAAVVGAEVTFAGTGWALVKITGLGGALYAGVHKYRLEIKGSVAGAHPVVAGAALIIR